MYVCERRRTLGQIYGIKVRCYWEHPWWNTFGNLENILRTYWELERNMLGTKEK
jgi:hypothetical protein